MLTKFRGLATSGRHNSAMITDAENSLPNDHPIGCLVSIFTVRINSKSFPLAVGSVPFWYRAYNQGKRLCRLRTRKVPTQIFGNVRCPILRVKNQWYAAMLVRPNERYIEEKQTELETENKQHGR